MDDPKCDTCGEQQPEGLIWCQNSGPELIEGRLGVISICSARNRKSWTFKGPDTPEDVTEKVIRELRLRA